MLNVENLIKIYKRNSSFFKKEGDFIALNKISFKLEQHKVLSIIGESGSGKTTLAKIICALLSYDDGKIEINNKNILDYTKQELSNTVQMIFQNPYASFNPKLTIGYSLTEAVDKNIKNTTIYQLQLFLNPLHLIPWLHQKLQKLNLRLLLILMLY